MCQSNSLQEESFDMKMPIKFSSHPRTLKSERRLDFEVIKVGSAQTLFRYGQSRLYRQTRHQDFNDRACTKTSLKLLKGHTSRPKRWADPCFTCFTCEDNRVSDREECGATKHGEEPICGPISRSRVSVAGLYDWR